MKSQNAKPRRCASSSTCQPRTETTLRYAAKLSALAALALPVHLSAQTPPTLLTTPPAQHTTTQRSAPVASPQHFTHSVTVDTTAGAPKRSTTLGISVTSTSTGAQITIVLPQHVSRLNALTAVPAPRSFYIHEPPRLVVDIPGIAGRRPERLRTPPESAVVRVRIGTHADKIRVVFDLRTAHRPNVASSSPGTLTFTVPEGSAAALDGDRVHQPVPEEEIPTITPTEAAGATTTQAPPPTTAASPITATAKATPPTHTAIPLPTLQPPTQSATALPATFTPQPLETHTPTPSQTPAPTHSATAAATVSFTATAAASAAITSTKTATGTATQTATPTASSTHTPQPEPTTPAPTPTAAATNTVAPTHTAQPAPTMPPTYTHTPTATPQPSPSATPSATATPSPSATPTPSATATHTATPSPQPTLPPTAAPTDTVAIAPTSSPTSTPTLPTQPALRISAYRFEYIEPGRTPVLKIELNQSDVSVQIHRSSARSYTIVVPGCGLAAPALELPHYPPGDFSGFQAISALYSDEQTEITVHVEQGTSLTTFVRGNEIWVQRLQ